MKKVFDKKTIDINEYLQTVGNYNEVILMWNGSKSYNGKSLISIINALSGNGETKIEIIANTETTTRFINDLKKINIKFEMENTYND